jgi:predicted phage terminase large subunit-like protein
MGTYESKPDGLMIIGATDAALTPDDGDWTEHGIAGVSNDGTIYLLDWWRGRVGPEEWIEKQLDLVAKWHPLAWFGEVGPIRRATEGRIRQRMIDRRAMVRMEWLPHIGDKTAKAQAIIAVAGMGRLLWPVASWVGEVQRQCLVFPAGSPDDAVDTLGMIGRGADTLGRQEENEYDYRKSAAMGIAI